AATPAAHRSGATGLAPSRDRIAVARATADPSAAGLSRIGARGGTHAGNEVTVFVWGAASIASTAPIDTAAALRTATIGSVRTTTSMSPTGRRSGLAAGAVQTDQTLVTAVSRTWGALNKPRRAACCRR